MLRRLHALYLRYAAVHADRLSSLPIGPFGRRIGQVERVERRGRDIAVAGWVDARALRLTWADGEAETVPDLPRADVAARRGLPLESGFELRAPLEARDLVLNVDRAGGPPLLVAIPHPSDRASLAAHRRLQRAFLRDLVRAVPDLARYLIAPGERTKSDVKHALRLDIARHGHVLDADWFAAGRAAGREVAPVAAEPVTIILPVHNAFDLVQACLARVEAHTDTEWSLIVVDDASTDPDLRPWLTRWASERQDRVTLLALDRNLGFIGAVNEGLSQAERQGGGGPIVLLNSDAMVPAGWASRLSAPLAEAGVASVTPMSNAAEILTIPCIGPGTALLPGEGDALDRVAQTFVPLALPEAPTGVGFCMAMSRDWLARIPRLDTAFGRGYGEEVDWCQKIAALGGRHLCQPHVVVEHVGGQSFGSAAKAEAVRRGNALIARRYPGYDAAVQKFIANDPLATPRLALGIALAGLRVEPLPVFLAHSAGGGAELALEVEIAQSPAAVVIRVGGPFRWQVEVHVGAEVMTGRTEDLACIRAMLAPVGRLRLIYSCGFGDPDQVTLPEALLSLRRDAKDDVVEVRLHDYLPLSPCYTLVPEEVFEGLPEVGSVHPAHLARRPDGTFVPLAEWRDAWGALMLAAQEVTAFSQAALDLVQAVYPAAAYRLRPHKLAVPIRAARPGRPDCVGVLGNINQHKGALVLRRIARRNPTLDFIIVGHADSAISFPRNVLIHGGYHPDEITDLTEHYRIGGWLMPAIWPETFSFATREALATGLPVVGFALGAQAEALDAAANGFTVPLAPTDTMAERLFDALRQVQAAALDASAGAVRIRY